MKRGEHGADGEIAAKEKPRRRLEDSAPFQASRPTNGTDGLVTAHATPAGSGRRDTLRASRPTIREGRILLRQGFGGQAARATQPDGLGIAPCGGTRPTTARSGRRARKGAPTIGGRGRWTEWTSEGGIADWRFEISEGTAGRRGVKRNARFAACRGGRNAVCFPS